MTVFLQGLSSVLPVFAFLAGLVFIDSYKLVRMRAILLSILAGGLAALASYFANSGLLGLLGVDFEIFSRYLAPLVEETLKAAFLFYLIRSFKVGFMVDAAIHGFAIGAGFALLENLYYVQTHPEAAVWTWIVRGFGTAIMHGGTMVLFGMVSKTLHDRAKGLGIQAFLPGLALAFVLHSLYNHFFLHPLLATALLVFALPLFSVVVFQMSEDATRSWLGSGFDTDQELLELLLSGTFVETRVGGYLEVLKRSFPGEVLADMLCLIRIHVELSIKAKGVLIMREAGFSVDPDPTLKATFQELHYLEKSIGTTGLLAIDPFLHTSSRDLWQLHMLDEG